MKAEDLFSKDIIEIAKRGEDVAFNKYTCKVVPCTSLDCSNCLFSGKYKTCTESRKTWFEEDYKEPIFFTKSEKEFIDLCGRINWVVRFKKGTLAFFEEKPIKDTKNGIWYCPTSPSVPARWVTNLAFNKITWEDEEPTSRADILKN